VSAGLAGDAQPSNVSSGMRAVRKAATSKWPLRSLAFCAWRDPPLLPVPFSRQDWTIVSNSSEPHRPASPPQPRWQCGLRSTLPPSIKRDGALIHLLPFPRASFPGGFTLSLLLDAFPSHCWPPGFARASFRFPSTRRLTSTEARWRVLRLRHRGTGLFWTTRV
jgi:hypothetical protein